MRLILASLSLALAVACTSSGDSVDSDDPSVTENGSDSDAGGDEESGDDTSAEPDAEAGDDDSDGPDSEPESDIPNVDVPVQVGDDDAVEPGEPEPADGAGGSDELPEPEVSSGGSSSGEGGSGGRSTGTGGSGMGGSGMSGGSAGAGNGQGGANPGECPRPVDDYALFGEECDLADFDCETYFRDECGCGCDEPECRPDDAYLATGDGCGIAAVSCPAGQAYFEDDCGCGCEGTTEPVCSEPADHYVMDDPSVCRAAFFTCDETQEPFFDDCGCGCRPSSGAACASPNGDFVGIPPDQTSSYWCWEYSGPSGVIADAEELEELLSGCEDPPQDIPDFSAYTVYAAVVPERTNVELAYVVEDINGTFHVGIQAEAYCGGPAPPDTVLIVAISKPDATVVEQRCADVGMCDPDNPLP